jgi:hypothetical protein
MTKKQWKPAEFIYEFTDENLTAGAGLGPLIDLFVASPQYEKLRACLPERKSNASYPTEQFALSLLSGFWYGHDSLDDLEEFDQDPGVDDKLGGLPSARAMGDWLRDFTPSGLENTNQFLTRQAFTAREQLAPGIAPTIDMDSTCHEQEGQKMEGLEWNYAGKWGLDSLVAFDELGLCYGMQLRPGNTFSAQGAGKMIERIFSHLDFKTEKHYRADSAFCNEEVIRACLGKGAKFTITCHGNTGWEARTSEITSWVPWQYSEEEIRAAEAKKRSLPNVELGSFVYQPGWSDAVRFYCVVKRTWQEGEDLFGKGQWKYYAVLTNRNLLTNSLQAIMAHHQKRGNSENFIREEKYGYDLKHFPCQKLSANQAYGQMALIAHNFLRAISLLYRPDKPHFSKKLRRRFVFLPGKLVKHARQLVMKIPQRFEREVRLIQEWTRAATSNTALAAGPCCPGH